MEKMTDVFKVEFSDDVWHCDVDYSDEAGNATTQLFDLAALRRHVLEIVKAAAESGNVNNKTLLTKLVAVERKTVGNIQFKETEKQRLSRILIDFLVSQQDLATQKPHLTYGQLRPYAAACAEFFDDSHSVWFDNPMVKVGSETPRRVPVGILWRRYKRVLQHWVKKNPELYAELNQQIKEKVAVKKALYAARERQRWPKDGKTLGRPRKTAPAQQLEQNLTAEGEF